MSRRVKGSRGAWRRVRQRWSAGVPAGHGHTARSASFSACEVIGKCGFAVLGRGRRGRQRSTRHTGNFWAISSSSLIGGG